MKTRNIEAVLIESAFDSGFFKGIEFVATLLHLSEQQVSKIKIKHPEVLKKSFKTYVEAISQQPPEETKTII